MVRKNIVSIGEVKPWGDVELLSGFGKVPLQYVALKRPLYEELVKTCEAAVHALRSYQYGNAVTDLAEANADSLDSIVRRIKELPEPVK